VVGEEGTVGVFASTVTQLLSGNKLTGAWASNWYNMIKTTTDPWTSYAPTWTGSISNPVINNGVISASYRQVGKTVDLKGKITMGTTTTFGSGVWLISLPVTAVDILSVGAAVIFDQSAAATRMAGTCNMSTTSLIQFWPGTGGGQVTNAIPMTWATTDLLIWSITYEAA
jgi:hypothetical protein